MLKSFKKFCFRYDISDPSNVKIDSIKVDDVDSLTYMTRDISSTYIYAIDSQFSNIVTFEFPSLQKLGKFELKILP